MKEERRSQDQANKRRPRRDEIVACESGIYELTERCGEKHGRAGGGDVGESWTQHGPVELPQTAPLLPFGLVVSKDASLGPQTIF